MAITMIFLMMERGVFAVSGYRRPSPACGWQASGQWIRLLWSLASFLFQIDQALPGQAAELPPGSRKVLFIDDEEVLYRSGTMKRVVIFEKPLAGPVIAPDRPWEGMIGWTSCFRDQTTGLFQLWYQAYQANRSQDKSLRCVVCYAESKDGLTWRKPAFDLHPYYEHRKTNIVLVGAGGSEGGYGDRYCNSVMVDPRDPDPNKRYKMLYYDWRVGEQEKLGAGTHVAFSPDGIHWTKHPDGFVSKTSYGGKGIQPPFDKEETYVEQPSKNGNAKKSWHVPMTMSDAMDVFFDTERNLYTAYGKMWIHGPDGSMAWKHGMGRIDSHDFIEWTKPRFILACDDRDPAHLEFHTSPVFLYNSQYLSLNQILDRSAGIIETELMSSRDGYRWSRDYRGTPVIPRGAAGSFDAGSIFTNATPIVVDEEVRFYYGAYRGTAVGGTGLTGQIVGSADLHSGVGVARTRLDRFVAVEPNPESPVIGLKKGQPKPPNTLGQVTLKPRSLEGIRSISINGAANGGSIRVEILNEDGFRLHGFDKDSCLAIADDGISMEVRWRDQRIEDLPRGQYHLRIHLDRASLFAVTLHPQPAP
jgi:hypothetical protein